MLKIRTARVAAGLVVEVAVVEVAVVDVAVVRVVGAVVADVWVEAVVLVVGLPVVAVETAEADEVVETEAGSEMA